VTYNGAAAPGISLDLRFYNGTTWSTVATTSTDGDGRYRFTGAASLSPGQTYYVRYGPNNSDSRYVFAWYGPDITTYTAGLAVAGGDFDIANVVLLSPAPGATVSLPVTFNWQRRGIAGDTYRVGLFDLETGDEWITDDLGDVGSFTMTGLPNPDLTGLGRPVRSGIVLSSRCLTNLDLFRTCLGPPFDRLLL